jgi:hypothetical protein
VDPLGWGSEEGEPGLHRVRLIWVDGQKQRHGLFLFLAEVLWVSPTSLRQTHTLQRYAPTGYEGHRQVMYKIGYCHRRFVFPMPPLTGSANPVCPPVLLVGPCPRRGPRDLGLPQSSVAAQRSFTAASLLKCGGKWYFPQALFPVTKILRLGRCL